MTPKAPRCRRRFAESRSIALIPQGGDSNVTVYTAPSPAPFTNLAMLDQLDDLIGNAMIPVGAYTGAVLTVSGNPTDIVLTTASNPEAGFAAPAGTTIASNQIQVQHTQGSGSNLTGDGDLRHAARCEHEPE
jgi:hypothetical protein